MDPDIFLEQYGTEITLSRAVEGDVIALRDGRDLYFFLFEGVDCDGRIACPSSYVVLENGKPIDKGLKVCGENGEHIRCPICWRACAGKAERRDTVYLLDRPVADYIKDRLSR